MLKDFEEFCNNFDIVDNALSQRELVRWNGRDILRKENLAEHSHLVVACLIKLLDEFKDVKNVRFNMLLKAGMLHDSLEMLRGDILSITKDTVPGLREFTDEEEEQFLISQNVNLNDVEKELLKLADLMACYKFLEKELAYPNNDYTKKVYISCKEKFTSQLQMFLNNVCGIKDFKQEINGERFVKGYEADAGVDILLDKDVTFLPMSTSTIDLNVKVIPKEGFMGVLCARTSAANKGLNVAMCPIDPNFNGNVTAIVHNISNKIIEYKTGQAFCQVVMLPISYSIESKVKKDGKRSNGKLGSTGV